MTSAALGPASAALPVGRRIRWLYPFVIFLSALLLFQVELIISDYVLPWFGGAAAVWTTTMLVFQALLFAGYLYAHLLSGRVAFGKQRWVQLALVAASVALIAVAAYRWPSPITPDATWKPLDSSSPGLRITSILLLSVGLPFFLLSTTGPLLQAWYARSTGQSPYRLYAVSNLGSVLGLLSYPFVVQPLLRLRSQGWAWAGMYVVFAAAMGLCLPVISSSQAQGEPEPGSSATTTRTDRALWILLPACASVALLAGTNVISLYIAAVPLIWVLPLFAYLLSFIICFGKPSWYVRGLFHAFFGLASVGLLLAIASGEVWFQLAACLSLVFIVCMICHGEVVRLQPPSKHATAYYLSLSGGGALGGIFVGILAPWLFPRMWEFQLSILATGLLVIIALSRDRSSWIYRSTGRLVPCSLVLLFALPYVGSLMQPQIAHGIHEMRYFRAATLFFLPVVPVAGAHLIKLKRSLPAAISVGVLAIVLLILSYGLYAVPWARNGITVARTRNFYGVLEVQQSSDKITLMHGKTVHGSQWAAASMRQMPTIYYGPDSGLGQFILNHPKRNPAIPMRFGIVGMGAGTIAAYGLPGDSMRFYELNPGVAKLARGSEAWFSYVRDSRAQVDVILGDGRISLERELKRGAPQNFDVLVLDAFNGDAVPVHLLTQEATEIYLQHLAPGGVLALHISSTTLDLSRVVLALAQHFRLYGTMMNLTDTLSDVSSVWIFLSRDPECLQTRGMRMFGRPLDQGRKSVLWTDDYTNITALLNR